MTTPLSSRYDNYCDIVIANNIQVLCADSLAIDNVYHSVIDTLWQEAIRQNPQLFNAQILMLHSWEYSEEAGLSLSTVWGDYKLLLASRAVPALRDKVRPLGVSGMMICKTGEQTLKSNQPVLVFARRSSKVASYPQYWELMPSGSISRETAENKADGQIDYLRQLREEFEEETGFGVDCIEEMSPFALIFDKQANIYDICVRLHISWSQESVIQHFRSNDEYTELVCVTLSQLPTFLHAHATILVPTSIALAEAFAALYWSESNSSTLPLSFNSFS